jgi:hypothetical protein
LIKIHFFSKNKAFLVAFHAKNQKCLFAETKTFATVGAMDIKHNMAPDTPVPFKFQIDAAQKVVRLFLPPMPGRPSPYLRIGRDFVRISTGGEHGFLQLSPVEDDVISTLLNYGTVDVHETTTEGQITRSYRAEVVR